MGNLSSLDADTGDSATYTVVGGADETKFSIGGAGDELVLNDGMINFETQASYQVDIRVVDAGGLTYDKSFNINVTDANDIPVVTSNNTTTVLENSTTVMNIIATDEDIPAQQLSYIISGGADAAFFSIDQTAGTLIFDFAPDFENPADMDADNIYRVEATVDDGHGGVVSQTLTITVVDDNEAPVLNDSAININESSSVGTLLGNAMATDPDAGDNLSYAISSGNSQGVFQINQNGELSIANNGGLTAGAVFTITLQVTDSSGVTDTATVTVQVATPANPFQSITEPSSGFVVENSPASEDETPDLKTSDDEPISEEKAETDVAENIPESISEEGPSDGGQFAGNDSSNGLVQVALNNDVLTKHQAYDQDTRKPIREHSTIPKRNEVDKNLFKAKEEDLESIISNSNSDYIKELDRVREDVQHDVNLEQTVVASSMAATTGLSVGYVVWLVRGGVLLSSLMSSLPAWRMIDPLPVLGNLNDDSNGDSGDSESLDSLIKKGSKAAKLKVASGHAGSETEMDDEHQDG